jgi:hypothetical protein
VWLRFEDCLNIDRPRYIHSNFVCGDGDFIILFCSLGCGIFRNSGTLKCWNEVNQYCSVSNKTQCTMYTFYEHA